MKISNYFLLILIALFAFNLNARAQCTQAIDDCGVLDLKIAPIIPNPICSGTSVSITPLITGSSYLSVQSYTLTATPPLTMIATGTGLPPSINVYPTITTTYNLSIEALGPNIVMDGDFSPMIIGGPCFASSYVYTSGASGSGAGPNPYLDRFPNKYTITTDLSTVTTPMAFALMGRPNMMAFNGDKAAPSVAWSEDLNVCGGQTYQFSFDYAAWTTGGGLSQPKLQVQIGPDIIIPAFYLNSTSWNTMTVIWNCPIGTSFTNITIADLTGADFSMISQSQIFHLEESKINQPRQL